MTKIVLLEALYGTYIQTLGTHFKDFTVATEAFCKKLNEAKTDSYFSFIQFESKKKIASLEKIINQHTTRSVNYFDTQPSESFLKLCKNLFNLVVYRVRFICTLELSLSKSVFCGGFLTFFTTGFSSLQM